MPGIDLKMKKDNQLSKTNHTIVLKKNITGTYSDNLAYRSLAFKESPY